MVKGIPWKCPSCGLEGETWPSVHVKCICGVTSPPTVMIVKKRAKTKKQVQQQQALANITSPEQEIDSHF